MDSKDVKKYMAQDHRARIEEAAGRLAPVLKETPLIKSDFYSAEAGCDVYLKPENLQTTGSFKIRGAYNKIASLDKAEIRKGVISASAGNHAQGVAFSAQKRGVKATIVMPNITPLLKVDATEAYGADVVLAGDVYDESFEAATRIAAQKKLTFVHPFDDYDVLCGQGTIAKEILEELPGADEILVPIGGGGLIAGILLWAKAASPKTKVIGVIPEGSPAIKHSLEKGKAVREKDIHTCAEGVAVKQPGDLTFAAIMKYMDEIVTVSERDIMENILLMMEKHKLVTEAAGVVSLAGAKKRARAGRKLVCVISGGNIDTVTVSSVVNQGMISRGRIMCFSVELPDKPGQLVAVAQLLAREGANVIELDHNQFKALDRYSDKVVLEVTVETNGHAHIDRVLKALSAEGFPISRIY
ncbi:MAG: threonine ammonia-lyase [Clostridiales Family XIII bacterium]|jgi:threonine dehydratase|nr:threonine ammonia-lyase [Clostridiales Family XIII bacterium]